MLKISIIFCLEIHFVIFNLAPDCISVLFVLSRRIGNPSLKAHSKSPYLRLSELMREIHAKSPDCWKNKVVEKGVQLWLCMENKLSQETEDLGELKSRKTMTFKQTNGPRGVPNC